MHEYKPKLKNEDECTGCGACIASCPKNAIIKKKVGYSSWIPIIDQNKCVLCGKCETICNRTQVKETFFHKAYVAYNKDPIIRVKSASGGVFSALATYVLNHGGIVFGAEMYFEEGKAVVEHNCVTQICELPRLLGSKYVQSDCTRAYREVKKELRNNRIVLFSGCSCQIVGLKKYLGNIDQTNLYTMDLICHGVPSVDFFNEYILFLEKKYKGKIYQFSFRTKEKGKITYAIHATFTDNQLGSIQNQYSNCMGELQAKEIKLPMKKSGYYRMFMGQESYRKACYHCNYATLDKPADITTGDYFELADDYPELLSGENAIDCSKGISCVITNTTKGEELLKKSKLYLYLKEVDPLVVQASHGNLNHPSKYSNVRNKLLRRYQKKGYYVIERYYFKRDIEIKLIHSVKRTVNLVTKRRNIL